MCVHRRIRIKQAGDRTRFVLQFAGALRDLWNSGLVRTRELGDNRFFHMFRELNQVADSLAISGFEHSGCSRLVPLWGDAFRL